MIGVWTAAAIVTGVGMCVVTELSTTPETGPLPQRIVLMTPGEIAWDGCDCGQFAQSLQSDYPSESFPQDTSQQTLRGAGCNDPPLAYQVLASIARCVSGLKGGIRPQIPTVADLLQDALRAEADAFVLRTAVECCLMDYKAERRITDFRVGRTDKSGPEGNCMAVVMQYWFSLV
jgi:hypothetical protein